MRGSINAFGCFRKMLAVKTRNSYSSSCTRPFLPSYYGHFAPKSLCLKIMLSMFELVIWDKVNPILLRNHALLDCVFIYFKPFLSILQLECTKLPHDSDCFVLPPTFMFLRIFSLLLSEPFRRQKIKIPFRTRATKTVTQL